MGRFNFRNIRQIFERRPPPPPRRNNNELNIIRNQVNNANNEINGLRNQLKNSKQEFENLKQSYNSKANELKLKEKQYNNLSDEYNVQLKDKQGLTDYLKINEHFTPFLISNEQMFNNTEGLTTQEGNAVATIATALDYNYYNSIVSQNKQLDYEIQNYKNIYSTDDQKVNYQTQQVYYLNNFNFYLFIVYCVFLLVLFYYLYYSKALLRYKKIGIALSLILYPFFIIMIEKNVFNSLQYLFSVLNGIAYTKNY